jgi:hypothetical protein
LLGAAVRLKIPSRETLGAYFVCEGRLIIGGPGIESFFLESKPARPTLSPKCAKLENPILPI